MCIVVVPRCVVGITGWRAGAPDRARRARSDCDAVTRGRQRGSDCDAVAVRAATGRPALHRDSSGPCQRAMLLRGSRAQSHPASGRLHWPAEQARTMMFMLYFSLRKRKSSNRHDFYSRGLGCYGRGLPLFSSFIQLAGTDPPRPDRTVADFMSCHARQSRMEVTTVGQ